MRGQKLVGVLGVVVGVLAAGLAALALISSVAFTSSGDVSPRPVRYVIALIMACVSFVLIRLGWGLCKEEAS